MVFVSAAWDFSQLWVLSALGLFARAFLIGAVYMRRVGMQLERLASSGQGGHGAALLSRWMCRPRWPDTPVTGVRA